MDGEDVQRLAKEFAIAERDVADAFLGESMDLARRICKWVCSTDARSPLQRGERLSEWAKKNHAGVYGSYNAPVDATVVEPIRKERTRYPVEQIARNLWRMES